MTINITFIAIWIAQWNKNHWKRFLLRHIDNASMVIIATRRIDSIDVDITRMQVNGKAPKFITFGI